MIKKKESTKEKLQTAYRILYLLRYLLKEEVICTENLMKILNRAGVVGQTVKNHRTAMRYLTTIEAFMEEWYEKEILIPAGRKGCYRIVNKSLLASSFDFSDREELLSYMQIIEEMLPAYYRQMDSEIRRDYEEVLREKRPAYLFRSAPLEELEDRCVFRILEEAIREREKLRMGYRHHRYEEIRPLRIIYMEGNFYLAAMTPEKELNNGFKFLRISDIHDIEPMDERFHETEEIVQAHRFIEEEIQTPFSRFGGVRVPVRLFGDKKAARHFSKKKHIPSQEERILEDGSIEITLYLDNYMEVAPLIRKWIPHLRIVEPAEWRDRMFRELTDYLGQYTG